MNNSVLGKTKEKSYRSVKKTKEKLQRHGTLNLKQQKKRNDLVSQPNSCTTKIFTENVLTIEKRKSFDIILFI